MGLADFADFESWLWVTYGTITDELTDKEIELYKDKKIKEDKMEKESSKERAVRILIEYSKEIKSMTELDFNKKSNEIKHGVMLLKYGETKEDKMSNKMPEVAKILGKELEEEFGIEDYDFRCTLTEKGLLYKIPGGWELSNVDTLQKLLTGELKIEWTPKDEEKVWAVFSHVNMPREVLYYKGYSESETLFKRGLIFRTELEAIQDMKDRGWWEE